jgi:hypothetical protein
MTETRRARSDFPVTTGMVEHSRKVTAVTLFIYALLLAAISLYLNRVKFGIGDDYSRITFPFKLSGMSYWGAVRELATNQYNGGRQVGAFFDILGPYLITSMDGFRYIRVAHLALLWQFQLSGVRTCLRQCGHR